MLVLIPNNGYNGQKLTKLVKIKMAAKTSNTMPHVPVTIFVKYKTTNTMASKIRITLSVDPIFFFMMINIGE